MNTKRSTVRALLAIAVTCAAAATTPACELLVDFDRSKIPGVDAGLPDATTADDASALPDAAVIDAGIDATASDAATDASVLTDAALSDATIDAGADAAPADGSAAADTGATSDADVLDGPTGTPDAALPADAADM